MEARHRRWAALPDGRATGERGGHRGRRTEPNAGAGTPEVRPHRITRNTGRAQCARTSDPCNKVARNGKGGPLPPRKGWPDNARTVSQRPYYHARHRAASFDPVAAGGLLPQSDSEGTTKLHHRRNKAALDEIERIVLRSLPMFKPQDGRALSFAGKFTEEAMNEDRLNMDIRKYLKVVGVTSQREIELAVRAALAKGTLVETSVLKPTMILRIPEIGLNHVIDGEIALV